MHTSVIIPVRNQPGCIRWTLESLGRQAAGVADFEVVVVDDGSTDGTPSVIESFDDQLRITLLRNDVNRGRSYSRNRAAAAASGSHLVFLDADSYSPPTLIGGHQRQHAARPDDVIIGRRIEMGWWNMNQLARHQVITDPLAFEEDQRDSRGLADTGQDRYARTPWLFLATHNMSLSTETFDKVGGFDESLTGWGYEDNEFAYRAFCYFGRESGHFVYDGDLVCYHMPHLRDWEREWQNTTTVLPYIKNKHRHYDVELLSHPPNHLRIAQTIPYYEHVIEQLKPAYDPEVAASVAELLTPDGRDELWIGCGVGSVAAAGRQVTVIDHAQPHSDQNYHLFGTYLPFVDDDFSAVVGVDLWRMLNPVDLSSFVMEALRVSDALYLAMSKEIVDDDTQRIGLVRDLDYLVDMLAARYTVDVCRDDDAIAVLRVSA